MLQQRINELNSAIINVEGDLVYTLGFYNSKMLNLYLNEGKKNWSSTGRYPIEDFSFENVKTDATFILQNNGIEIARYHYIKVQGGTLVYENEANKSGKGTLVYEVRKEIYNNSWNLRVAEKSLVFDDLSDMYEYVWNTYNYHMEVEALDEQLSNT